MSGSDSPGASLESSPCNLAPSFLSSQVRTQGAEVRRMTGLSGSRSRPKKVSSCLKRNKLRLQSLGSCFGHRDYEIGFQFNPVFLTVKKLNTPEYRHYLKLWNEETKPKRENTKDLPKLNQVKLFCFFFFLTLDVRGKANR